MFEDFMLTIEQLPPLSYREDDDYRIFYRFNLTDISENDLQVIIREVQRRGIEKSKKCWHPNASDTACNVDSTGKIIVSAAHSIQENGVLSKIVENGHLICYTSEKDGFAERPLGKKDASIFWGFCNFHDAIFRPIEVYVFTGTPEQNYSYIEGSL